MADHARATAFLIADGVLPSNEGRGYVLRKIVRRAIRHGRLLGQEKPFLKEMVSIVIELMADAYPELLESRDRVMKIVDAEETRFARTLSAALSKLDDLIHSARQGLNSTGDRAVSDVVGGASRAEIEYIRGRANELDGEDAFKLYDTFGLPIDFIHDAARDGGVSFDQSGFDRAMEEQRTRARASWKGGAAKEAANPAYVKIAETFRTEP